MPTARRLAGLFFVCALAVAPPAQAVSLASVDRACRLLDERLTGVASQKCRDARLHIASGWASVQGQPILLRDFAATSRKHTPKRVLLMGGIHGDELSSIAIVFDWMQRLEQEKFQPFHWRVVPCLNPDGALRRPATRTNARGVDLNRNFPTPEWNAKALAYWQGKTRNDPRRYPGPHAGSEPETQWLAHQIRQFKPDAIVAVHAPYGVLDFDGPRTPPRKLGFLNLNELGTYPGSLGNFAGEHLGIPVITLELPHGEKIPTPSQSARIWSDLLSWFEKNLPRGEPPLYQRLGDQNWAKNAP